MALWRSGVAYWLFPTGFDTAVPPVIVEEVGKKEKQPTPVPTVILISLSTPEGASKLKRAIDLILKAAVPTGEPLVPTDSHKKDDGDGIRE